MSIILFISSIALDRRPPPTSPGQLKKEEMRRKEKGIQGQPLVKREKRKQRENQKARKIIGKMRNIGNSHLTSDFAASEGLKLTFYDLCLIQRLAE